MIWWQAPWVYFIIGAIVLLSFVAYPFRKRIWDELKNWAPDGISLWIFSFKREVKPRADEPSDPRKLAFEELRQLKGPVSKHLTTPLTERILGISSLAFWDQVGNHAFHGHALRVLAEDPFFLEGLLCVFEKRGGQLPANIGALIDLVLKEQWTKEKLGARRFIKLEDAQWSLSSMLYGSFPETELPVQHEFSFQSDHYYFEHMLMRLGERSTRLPVAVRLLLIPIQILRFPFDVLFSLFGRLLSALGRRKFYESMSNFFERFSLSRRLQRRRGKLLLELAQKANILAVDYKEEKIHVRHRLWVDYFHALVYLREAKNDVAAVVPMQYYSKRWNRLATQYDQVVVIISGLFDQPSALVERLATLDPFVAAQCIAGGVTDVSTNARRLVYTRLRENMLQVLGAGEERSYDSARFLRVVDPDPRVILDILETIRRLGPYENIIIKLVKIIAEYGDEAVDLLIDQFDQFSDIRYYVLTALAYTYSSRAFQILKKATGDQDALVKIRATALLAIFYDDAESVKAMHRYMFAEDDYADGKRAWWHNITQMRAVSLPFAVTALTVNVERFKSIYEGRIVFSKEWRFGREKFLDFVKGFEDDDDADEAEDMLIDAVLAARDDEIRLTMIAAIGAMKGKRAYFRFAEILKPTSPEGLRLAIIAALGQMREARALGFLLEQAESSTLVIAGKAIHALGQIASVGAVNLLERKLRHTGVAIENPSFSDYGYPIAYLAMSALEQIGNFWFYSDGYKDGPREPDDVLDERGRALDLATAWCAANLERPEKLGWGNTTLGKECQNYLEYRINTSDSHRSFYEWSQNHPKAN